MKYNRLNWSLLGILFLLMSIIFSACSDEPSSNDYGIEPGEPLEINRPSGPLVRTDMTISNDEKNVCNSLKDFENRLFAEACRQAGHDNCVISPFGVELALVSILNTTTDKNLINEIKHLMGLENYSMTLINQCFSHLIAHLYEADPFHTDVTMENLIAISNAYSKELDPNFTKFFSNRFLGKTGFDANVDGFSYTNNFAINGHVFNAFIQEKNTTDSFTNYDNSTSMVEMMNSTFEECHYKYIAETEKFKLLRLYMGAIRFSVTFVLPHNASALDELCNTMGDIQNNPTYGLFDCPLKLQVPVLNISESFSVKPVLKAMGLSALFNNEAKFNKILNQKTTVSGMYQALCLKFDNQELKDIEHYLIVDDGSLKPYINQIHPQSDILVNRPFVFYVNGPSTCLMMGKIEKM